MVNFKKLVAKKSTVDPSDLLKLFESLDRKTSHSTLRPAQIEALEALSSKRSDRDAVLKMPTGMGKSTVGLIYLQSHLAESGKPVVYLCPTVQLAHQVLKEASKLGIKAHEYPANQSAPHHECAAGKAVIVCSYDKLFNARSTFRRSDVNIVPHAIVLDDAHSGVEEVRDSFTLTLPTKEFKDSDHWGALLKVLGRAAAAHSKGAWEDIQQGVLGAIMEVPYWHWRNVVEDVRSVLSKLQQTGSLPFVWGNVEAVLRWCRCVVASTGIEIAPDISPVHACVAYDQCPHRLFMSATLADDSILVKELDCSTQASNTPVVAGAKAGMGERMVVAPSLVDRSLDRGWVLTMCEKLSKHFRVVALCDSERATKDWEQHGATVLLGPDVEKTVEGLRNGTIPFAAMAQRYDGIDLPDESCRVLVIDGLPLGQGLIDRYDSERLSSPGGVRNRIVYRIEQGMGRAVRSHADYAVVLLVGPELASFISRKEVLANMSADAKAQLELALELAQLVIDEGEKPQRAAVGLILKCLNRDEGWKDFYEERVRSQVIGAPNKPDEGAIQLANAERESAQAAFDGDPARGAALLDSALAKHWTGSDTGKAVLLQRLAALKFEVNSADGLALQAAAYQKNRQLLKPPTGVQTKLMDFGAASASGSVLKFYSGFTTVNGLIAAFETLRVKLQFGAPHGQFESALSALAQYIGAEGSRPEYDFNEGPDNLIEWGDLSLVIEAKNEAQWERLPKHDAAQLAHSVNWFRQQRKNALFVPVVVGPSALLEKGVVLPDDARIMTPDLLKAMLQAVSEFTVALGANAPSQWNEKDVRKLLTTYKLDGASIVRTFTRLPK